jgi:poly(A) polymerase
VGEVDVTLADWWQEFSMADAGTREDLVQQLRDQQRQQPKTGGKAAPRGGRTHRSTDMPPDAVSTVTMPLYGADGRMLDEDTAPKRRRPRRGGQRGPRGDGDAGDANGAAGNNGGGSGPADAF